MTNVVIYMMAVPGKGGVKGGMISPAQREFQPPAVCNIMGKLDTNLFKDRGNLKTESG